MFASKERHCPLDKSREQDVYLDYSLYAETVPQIPPLPFEEWMLRTFTHHNMPLYGKEK